jgi:hypothetical protein
MNYFPCCLFCPVKSYLWLLKKESGDTEVRKMKKMQTDSTDLEHVLNK